MDYYNNDHHDEDVLSPTNTSSFSRRISNDNNSGHYQANRSARNWQNLHETNIHSIRSNDEDQRLMRQQPFYLGRQPFMEDLRREIASSQIYQPPFDSNINKSKWEIRLPELLNSTVGPDRQKRDTTRRHTTQIVFQRSNSQDTEFMPHSTNRTYDDRPTSPLVKQLKQKFDRMTINITPSDMPKISYQTPTDVLSKPPRVARLTSPGVTVNRSERLVRQSRSVLPVRPSAEMNVTKSRTGSVGSLNNRTSMATNRTPREKASPPVSYPRHYYPPPSTTSVVKQLIGGGATLVYDSMGQQDASKLKASVLKHQRTIEQRTEVLKNTNSVLTGRQIPPKSPSDGYATVKQKNSYEKMKTDDDDDSDENYYEPMSRQISVDSFERKPASSPTERWHNRTNPADNDSENYYPVYDMNK